MSDNQQPGTAIPTQNGNGGTRLKPTVGSLVAAAVVGALAVGAFVLFEPGSGSEYELTTPRTVAGEYQREGKGNRGDGKAFGDKKVPGMKTSADVSAEYRGGTTKKLQLGGAYGTVKDPEKAVDWVLEQTRSSLKTETGAKAKGSPQEFEPSGFDGDDLKCQEFKISKMALSMCSWADDSTVGTVYSMVLTEDRTSTERVELKKTAELTAKVRKDALVEAD
jgi:hypothetical protein